MLLALAVGAPSLGCSEQRELPHLGSRPGHEPAAAAREAEAPPEARAERIRPEPRPEPPPVPAGLEAPPDVAAPPPQAQRTASGLASNVLQAGTGDRHPGPRDGVSVNYTGWRAEDGEMFDSSVRRGRPASFTLDHVIPGWTEGLQLMVVGEKRRFWIPANLAYEGRPGPQGMLVFDVELLAVNPAPATPANLAAPPRNAGSSESGLRWVVLQPGEGTRHPLASDQVEVHYSGWRAEDGELFDSSRTRGEPARFGLDRVIPGWTEGVQLMVEGEQRRFWIPANLAYEGRRGPQGTLVFDVELIRILTPEAAAP